MAYLILAALVFALCFAVDKAFSGLFRGKAQHKTGLSVKLNKRYALFGLFLAVLGISGVVAGSSGGKGLTVMALALLALGVGLIVYYLSFGIYYDAESFLYSAFGKKGAVHRFGEIQAQKLYVLQGGALLVELHMEDGSAVSIQTTMEGAYPFLDHAYAAWCRQRNLDPETCDFHDPARCKWFPDVEVQ